MIDRNSDNWKALPLFVRGWFVFNFLQFRPTRNTATRVELTSHIFGFLFCSLGFFSEAALAGGIIMLATAYFFHLLKWQGDKYGIWYETSS